MKSRACSCVVAFAFATFAIACSSGDPSSATNNADTGAGKGTGETIAATGLGSANAGNTGLDAGARGVLGEQPQSGGQGGVDDPGGEQGTGGAAGTAGAAGQAGTAGAAGQGGSTTMTLPTKDAGLAASDGGPDGGAAPAASCKLDCGSNGWACWPMPNPKVSDAGTSNGALPNPATYTDNNDQTVTDNRTCLRWQKDVNRNSPPFDWKSANAYCAGLHLGSGVNTGWRLPTRIELISLIDTTASTPAIEGDYFPSTRPQRFWTASAEPSGDTAWYIEFQSGEANKETQSTMYAVRCVQGNGTSIASAPPPDQYSAVAAGEVLDQYTGLVWQRDDSQGTSVAGLAWADAERYCANLKLGTGDNAWRVPTMKELATLIDDQATSGPAVNKDWFATTASAPYWTSSTFVDTKGRWTVDMKDGTMAYGTQERAVVRCVR